MRPGHNTGLCMKRNSLILIAVLGWMTWLGTFRISLAEEGSRVESPAERGFRLLRTQPYSQADLSVAEFDELWRYWPDRLRQQAEKASAAQRRQMAFERYGMVADPERPEGPPLGLVDDQQGGWVMNCLACHQGTVDGQLYWGAGNTQFAFQTLIDDVLAMNEANGQKSNPMMRFLSLGSSNGTTNAQVFSVLLSSLRDRDLNRLPFPRPTKYRSHDLDAPPLWNVKHKQHLYIDGFVPKSHRVIMQFTLVPTNQASEIKKREDGFRDILAWIESLEPPKYPGPIDEPLALRGREAFNRVCAECHGTYGPEGNYPELRIPIEQIQTDPVRLTGMPKEHRRFYRESWFGNYGQLEVVEEPDGYVAPPLHGIWASAPYLHNGSVPTLWHLMHSTERPKVWLRKPQGYDHQRIGLEVLEMQQVPTEIQEAADRRRYFDTGLSGKSAQGHNYPDQLDDSDKMAVIEYLKTL